MIMINGSSVANKRRKIAAAKKASTRKQSLIIELFKNPTSKKMPTNRKIIPAMRNKIPLPSLSVCDSIFPGDMQNRDLSDNVQ